MDNSHKSSCLFNNILSLLSGLIMATPPEGAGRKHILGGIVCSYIIPEWNFCKEELFLSSAMSDGWRPEHFAYP
jgi:hypothetical protein